MSNPFFDAPLPPGRRELLIKIGEGLDHLLNGEQRGPDAGTGFVLITFAFGSDAGRLNFVSNGACGPELIPLFKTLIALIEGQADVAGHA